MSETLVQFPKMGIEFEVNPILFTVGRFSVTWYGLLIGIGFLLAVIYGFRQLKKMGIDEDKMLDVIIWGLIGGIVGARLYYIIFFPGVFFTGPTLMDNLIRLINIKEGGLAIYGGLIGALVSAAITAKIKKMNILAVFDIASLGFLIGQGIGRWGNFTNQEAFGLPTDLPWGMKSAYTADIAVHPCFLYESLLCLLGFAFLHVFNQKYRRYDGQTFLLYVVWYGMIRFFIEGLRTDSLMIGNTNVRVSQVVAGLSALTGLVFLICLRDRTTLSGCGNPKIMEKNGIDFTTEISRETESADNISTKDDAISTSAVEESSLDETHENIAKDKEE